MGADSTIGAVLNLYAGLNPSFFPGGVLPPIELDEMVQQGNASQQIHPPYVLLIDEGELDKWDTEQNAATGGTFLVKCYANLATDCDKMLKAIMYNGQIPNLVQGLAFATLNLNAPLYCMRQSVIPGESVLKYSNLDYSGKRVYYRQKRFSVRIGTRGTG